MPRILFLSPQSSRRRTTSSRHQRFFLSVVGELGFHYNAVERASSLSGVDAVEWKPCAQWSPPGQYRSPCPQCRVRCVVGKLARHRHWTSSRSRISAARSAHLASVSRSSNRVAPRNRPSLRHFESEPGSIPFGTLWRSERHGACPAAGSLLFYFCQLIQHVCLLVFLLVSATTDEKTCVNSDSYGIKRLSGAPN